jgi:hypothetical protein
LEVTKCYNFPFVYSQVYEIDSNLFREELTKNHLCLDIEQYCNKMII